MWEPLLGTAVGLAAKLMASGFPHDTIRFFQGLFKLLPEILYRPWGREKKGFKFIPHEHQHLRPAPRGFPDALQRGHIAFFQSAAPFRETKTNMAQKTPAAGNFVIARAIRPRPSDLATSSIEMGRRGAGSRCRLVDHSVPGGFTARVTLQDALRDGWDRRWEPIGGCDSFFSFCDAARPA
ncbi:hypothetical protein IMZ48_21545 [Candidatus Bathyarchaeota archaeon]|nr:hypothetical protein [Candidatus Bathyarchaeota archaeon]